METAFTQKHSKDHAEGRLQFTFYCDICHKEYTAPATPAPHEQGVFQKWKLQKAYTAAFNAAQEDAQGHFNRCVRCKRWVCDADFSPDYGLCIECDCETNKR